jgi:PIN domain nuclease of toxin-antitoxin system
VTYLLDTHILLWWFLDQDRLSEAQRGLLEQAEGVGPLCVSDISLWEIATLVSLKRVVLTLPVRTWLERATAPPLVRRVGLSPVVAGELAALPDSFHRDPADRIIVATGRVLGATLLTRDSRIIDSDLIRVL